MSLTPEQRIDVFKDYINSSTESNETLSVLATRYSLTGVLAVRYICVDVVRTLLMRLIAANYTGLPNVVKYGAYPPLEWVDENKRFFIEYFANVEIIDALYPLELKSNILTLKDRNRYNDEIFNLFFANERDTTIIAQRLNIPVKFVTDFIVSKDWTERIKTLHDCAKRLSQSLDDEQNR